MSTLTSQALLLAPSFLVRAIFLLIALFLLLLLFCRLFNRKPRQDGRYLKSKRFLGFAVPCGGPPVQDAREELRDLLDPKTLDEDEGRDAVWKAGAAEQALTELIHQLSCTDSVGGRNSFIICNRATKRVARFTVIRYRSSTRQFHPRQ